MSQTLVGNKPGKSGTTAFYDDLKKILEYADEAIPESELVTYLDQIWEEDSLENVYGEEVETREAFSREIENLIEDNRNGVLSGDLSRGLKSGSSERAYRIT